MRFLWFFAFFASFCLSGLALAQTTSLKIVQPENIRRVPTLEVQPLQILLKKPHPDIPLSGEILARKPLKAKGIQFSLYNDQGAKVWEDELNLEYKISKIIAFYYSDLEVFGELTLSVKAYDEFSNTIGAGERKIVFPKGTKKPEILHADSYLSEDRKLQFSLFVQNGAFDQILFPQVKVYSQAINDENLVISYDATPLRLRPEQKQKIEFALEEFLAPGVYATEVGLIDFRTQKQISGLRTDQIFNDGDYLKILSFDSFVDEENPQKAEVKLFGLAVIPDEVTLMAKVVINVKGEVLFDKTIPVPLEQGYFSQNLKLDFPKPIDGFDGTLQFFMGNELLLNKDFSVNGEGYDPLVANYQETETSVEGSEPTKVKRTRPAKTKKILWWEEFKASPKLWMAAVGGVMVLLALVILIKSKGLGLMLFFVGMCLFMFGISQKLLAANSQTRVFPVIEWTDPSSNPIWAFNPENVRGFQILPIKGRVYNFLSGNSLFKQNRIDSMRFNLYSPSGKSYQFPINSKVLVPESEISIDQSNGAYSFLLDLGKLNNLFPIAQESQLLWEDGEWQIQLLFHYKDKVENIDFWFATDQRKFGSFIVDTKAPELEVAFFSASNKPLQKGRFTNKPVRAKIKCTDEFAGCAEDELELLIKGNFCSDESKCNTEASRYIQVCDTVENCTQKEIIVDFYDPVPPKLFDFNFDNKLSIPVKSIFDIYVRYVDPATVEDEQELEQWFEDSLCTDNRFFVEDQATGFCKEKNQTCITKDTSTLFRGKVDSQANCSVECPAGYEFREGLCLRECGYNQFKDGQVCFPWNLAPPAS